MMKYRSKKNENGAIAIIFAVAIVALLLIVALVVDIGQAYVRRSKLQTVVDAAALSGVQDLALDKEQSVAFQSASDYADLNADGTFDNLSITFPEEDAIQVEAAQSDSTFFARIAGIDMVQVKAKATAKTELASSVNDVVPIAVPFQFVDNVGQENEVQLDLKDNNASGVSWMVNFGDSNADATDYANWIQNGYPQTVTIGDSGQGEGAKVSNAVKNALDHRIANDQNMVVPLYDSSISGNTFDIVGFAEFHITGYNFNGNPKYLTGYFTTGNFVKGVGGGGDTPDYGIVTLRLTD